eukprot:1447376-Rhodomonas_salina.1
MNVALGDVELVLEPEARLRGRGARGEHASAAAQSAPAHGEGGEGGEDAEVMRASITSTAHAPVDFHGRGERIAAAARRKLPWNATGKGCSSGQLPVECHGG